MGSLKGRLGGQWAYLCGPVWAMLIILRVVCWNGNRPVCAVEHPFPKKGEPPAQPDDQQGQTPLHFAKRARLHHQAGYRRPGPQPQRAQGRPERHRRGAGGEVDVGRAEALRLDTDLLCGRIAFRWLLLGNSSLIQAHHEFQKVRQLFPCKKPSFLHYEFVLAFNADSHVSSQWTP